MATTAVAKRRSTTRRKKGGYQSLTKGQKRVVWVAGGFIAFIAGRWVWNYIKHADLHKELRTRDQYQVTPNVNLQSVAHNIYDAFYNADITGSLPSWLSPGEGSWSEDEEEAIRELKKVPPEYITDLAKVYADLHGHNLYTDFRRFLDSSDYRRVENLLEMGLHDGWVRAQHSMMSEGYDPGNLLGIASIGMGAWWINRGVKRDKWLPMFLGTASLAYGVATLAGFKPFEQVPPGSTTTPGKPADPVTKQIQPATRPMQMAPPVTLKDCGNGNFMLITACPQCGGSHFLDDCSY